MKQSFVPGRLGVEGMMTQQTKIKQHTHTTTTTPPHSQQNKNKKPKNNLPSPPKKKPKQTNNKTIHLLLPKIRRNTSRESVLRSDVNQRKPRLLAPINATLNKAALRPEITKYNSGVEVTEVKASGIQVKAGI